MKQISRNKDRGTTVERYKKSFFHAVDGIVYALKYEHNMIIIFLIAILTIIAGRTFNISVSEWLFCILLIGLVMGSEMINTSIEALVDLETLDIHPLAKIAKDAASSATLIFSITALIGGIIIFLPKVLLLIKLL